MGSLGSWNFDRNFTLTIEPGYVSQLGDTSTLSDCFLSEEEIGSNAEASTLANMVAASICAQMNCRDSSAIRVEAFDIPGCAGDATTVRAMIGRRLEVDTANRLLVVAKYSYAEQAENSI